QTQHPGGPIQIPRRWLRVKRNYAPGELKWHVPTLSKKRTIELLSDVKNNPRSLRKWDLPTSGARRSTGQG
ncbi:MAG: hypothetical protein ACK6B2_08035, partial [Planctomycetota bacterium]